MFLLIPPPPSDVIPLPDATTTVAHPALNQHGHTNNKRKFTYDTNTNHRSNKKRIVKDLFEGNSSGSAGSAAEHVRSNTFKLDEFAECLLAQASARHDKDIMEGSQQQNERSTH